MMVYISSDSVREKAVTAWAQVLKRSHFVNSVASMVVHAPSLLPIPNAARM